MCCLVKFPAASSSFGLSSHSGKRDSFGKYLSSSTSLKDQLHTLLEEEEEEEEVSPISSASNESINPNLPLQSQDFNLPGTSDDFRAIPETNKNTTPARHRPANLSLRPLSLISSPTPAALPTPSPAPSSSARSGLRMLSLTPQPDSSFTIEPNRDSRDSDSQGFRTSRSIQKHSNGNGVASSASSPKRQSSISYIRSGSSSSPSTTFPSTGLPTPGPTPTTERRPSCSSIGSSGSIGGRDRMNSSEEVFLQQSHTALLSRIAELERALRSQSHSRPHSRPASLESSDNRDFLPASKSDEMLQLIADLKSERDELHRDIEGWKQRVHDLEHSKTVIGHEKAVLERKLGAEKRENWLKSEKIGLLEIEKNSLNRELNLKDENINNLNRRLLSTQNQLQEAHQEWASSKEDVQIVKRQLAETQMLVDSYKGVDLELKKVREALNAEQVYRQQLISQLDAAGVFNTPKISTDASGTYSMIGAKNRSNGTGFMSVDSTCTTVETDEQYSLKAPFTLKAVEEECEDHSDEDELAGYEDEDDLDLNFTSPAQSSSTYDSDDDFPQSLSHLLIEPISSASDLPSTSSSSPSPTPSPCPTPVPLMEPETTSFHHEKRASLSKTWTFPREGSKPSARYSQQEEVDRFFGCLEEIENSPPSSSIQTMDNRNLFSQRLQFGEVEDEDLPPFILPVQNNVESEHMLEAVLEEEEEEEEDIVSHRSMSGFPISISQDSLNSTSLSSSGILFDERRESSKFLEQLKKSETDRFLRSGSSIVDVPSSPTASSSMGSFSSERLSPIVTPKIASSRSLPVSRIPSLSPPAFIQAKASLTPPRVSPIPPKRKPVPISPSRIPSLTRTSLTPITSKHESVTAESPSRLIRQSSHGSGFVIQLKSPSTLTHSFFFFNSDMNDISLSSSSTVIKKPKLSNDSVQTAASLWPRTNNNDLVGYDQDDDSSSQPLVSSLSRFLPLPSFSWKNNKSKPQSSSTYRKPAFVAKEVQLSKLRMSLASRSDHERCFVDICQCRNCRGDIISL